MKSQLKIQGLAAAKGFAGLLMIATVFGCAHKQESAWPTAPELIRTGFDQAVVQDLFENNPRYSSIAIQLDTTPEGEVLRIDASWRRGGVDHIEVCPGQEPTVRFNGRPAPEPIVRSSSRRLARAACVALARPAAENDLRNGLQVSVSGIRDGYKVFIKPHRLATNANYTVSVTSDFNVVGTKSSLSKDDLKTTKGQ